MYYYYPWFTDEETKARSRGRSHPESTHLITILEKIPIMWNFYYLNEMRQLQGYTCEFRLRRRRFATHLTREHGTEVIAAGSQHNPMRREVFLLYSQSHVAESVALPEGVHWIEDGFSMSICHYVFGGHNASHQAIWRRNERSPWLLQLQDRKKQ